MRVLCDPNPMCFGSTATMRAVLAHLADAEVTVLGSGPVLDLRENLNVIECDVKDETCLASHRSLIERSDVYVSFGNNTNVPQILKSGVPLVFVDALFWMKRNRTQAMDGAAAYVVENYPGVQGRLDTLPPHNTVLVGPILAGAHRSNGPYSPLLVNLGGAASPYLVPGSTTHYPRRVVTMMNRVAIRVGLRDVPIAMGSAARATVEAEQLVHPVTLAQTQYLQLLESARMLLTAPGLNAPLEAFSLGVPVAFLPPQNLTQVFHLRDYVDAGIATASLNLDDLVPGSRFDVTVPEAEGTASVLRALNSLGPAAWQTIEDLVVDQILRSAAVLELQVARQHEWLEGLGSGGAEAVAGVIRGVAR